ncbi:MAG: phosphoribosylformylglycinamidine synthase subunit PurS [Chloroflexi bacterium]|nr:phosphoribosylformylglycinamidine synthase subunit PurS [Chloroflexota bacterium]
MYLARIYVTPKPGVNDPQGLAILGGLHNLGYGAVQRVRAGKYLEVRLDGASVAEAEAKVREMCQRLLANPVIEEFRVDVEETL